MPPHTIENNPRVSSIPARNTYLAQHWNGLYISIGKRALDLTLSAAGLALFSPLLLVTGLCVKCTSRGPMLFRQWRVGRAGNLFQIVKFRTMLHGAEKNGLGITASSDQRVTKLGRFLRRFKIDELPQLWNVLLGEMTFVGPRPELPVYVYLYTPDQRRILSVRPGITDPASLAFRHEEELLARQSDPESFYIAQLLPEKLSRGIAYVQNISLQEDVRILFATLATILYK